MESGKKIKMIREFRGMTQRELGELMGYPQNSAGIRIAQYESGKRGLKKETALMFSKLLGCSSSSFWDCEMGYIEKTFQSFLWLEEFNLLRIEQCHVPIKNEQSYAMVFGVTAIAFDGMMNGYMDEWGRKHRKYSCGEISKHEYFEWKINWNPNQFD